MAEVSYLGYSRVNNDTDIDGDLVVSGSARVESLLIAGSEPVTF